MKDELALKIYRERRSGAKVTELAKEYRVTNQTIYARLRLARAIMAGKGEEYKQDRAEKYRDWYRSYPEKRRVASRRYYDRNRKKIHEYNKDYYAKRTRYKRLVGYVERLILRMQECGIKTANAEKVLDDIKKIHAKQCARYFAKRD